MLTNFLLPLLAGLCASDPLRPYPLPDAHLKLTSILNHADYVGDLSEPQWYLDNIPFVDFPDQSTQDVYYYRASVVKRHLKYAHEGHGFVFTEFIHPVSWASKFQTIPDSAGHQILEARWLRDPRYVKDTIQLYTRAGAEAISGVTYTHFIHQAIYEQAQATGDAEFLASQLDGMIRMYGLWNTTQDSSTGLYHRTPLLDAQEFSLPGFLTGGPNGGPVQEWDNFQNDFDLIDLGPETYRPSFNSYMVAASQRISDVAAMAENNTLSQSWRNVSADLYDRVQKQLYDSGLNFWIDRVQGTNAPARGRQMIGYYPYRFGLGTDDSFVQGLEIGLDNDHFLTEFGPTTLEQTNPYYSAFKNLTYCCIWNGQSWPFSSSIYLGTLARLARENRSAVVTSEFFQQAFDTYTKTNYKDGRPYTGEAHYPTIDQWSADTTNHSENYFHSTYMDNIFTNLLGVIPTLDNRLEMRPLVPGDWDHFAVENLPYHGSLMSILWDADGSHYPNHEHDKGLSVYANGAMMHHQADLSPFNVTLSPPTQAAASTLAATPAYENILANVNAPHGLPNISASYIYSRNGDTSPYEAWKLIDGLTWYDKTPDNRWTSNQTSSALSTLNLTLPRPRTFSSLSLAVFADTSSDDPTAQENIIDCPAAIQISDTRTGMVLAERSPWKTCTRNALNTIDFADASPDRSNATTPSSTMSMSGLGANVTTDSLTITLLNKRYRASALSELQIWVPANTGPRYEAEDGLLGTFIGGFEGRHRGMNGTIVPATKGSETNGGVMLGETGWVELAGVRAKDVQKGGGGLGVLGRGPGTVTVQTNWLKNTTMTLADEQTLSEQRVQEAGLLPGNNVVTLFHESGTPFIDAITVV